MNHYVELRLHLFQLLLAFAAVSASGSSDQRSPNISREILTGQPDRRFDSGSFDTRDTLSNITCNMQVVVGLCAGGFSRIRGIRGL